MSGKIRNTLDSVLEHGSHAWRALEVAGLAEDDPDGAWPPRTQQPPGSAAYHLAAMLRYVKQLYDDLGAIEEAHDALERLRRPMMLDDKTKFSGNNILLLCPADMMRAIEWYLNEVLLKVPVKVTGVHEINTALNSGNFEIKIVPGEAHDA